MGGVTKGWRSGRGYKGVEWVGLQGVEEWAGLQGVEEWAGLQRGEGVGGVTTQMFWYTALAMLTVWHNEL